MAALSSAWGGQAGFVEQVCTPPLIALCLAGGPDSIMVSWSPVAGNLGYSVYCGVSGEDMLPVTEQLPGSPYVIGSLGTGPYFIQVTADLGDRSSEASAVVCSASIPAVPSGLTAAAADSAVFLSWNALPGLSYSVYQGTASGEEGSVPVQSGIEGGSATLGGLENGTTYYFTIAASAAVGCFSSGPSNEVSATPFAPVSITWDPLTDQHWVLSNGNLTASS